MEKIDSELRKGTWTAEEDNLLRTCVQKYGEGKWHLVPHRAGTYISKHTHTNMYMQNLKHTRTHSQLIGVCVCNYILGDRGVRFYLQV